MFSRLLIPLDGSQLAEAALPPAAYLAERLHAGATLIHVVETDAPERVHGERHLTTREEAEAYLTDVAQRTFPPQAAVERHVHTRPVGDVAESLAEHVSELGTDLIVMCTHGRGGVRDWLYGSIAQQVVARGAAPVLLISPTENAPAPPFTCRRALAPVDGSPEHEVGLDLAAKLASACGATLHVVAVVHTLGTLSGPTAAAARFQPGAAAALLDLTEAEAAAYLEERLAALPADCRAAGEVRRGDPARTIAAAARETGADLLVLATHGKAGMAAFWSGSVAPKLSSLTKLPALLAPVRRYVPSG